MATELITPRPEFSAILREQETFAAGDADDVGNRINSWFDLLMIQSGIGLSPSLVLFLCLLSGIALGGVVFVIQENPITTAIAAFFGFIAPIVVAVTLRARRQSVMMNQMPPMIDELARAAKTGRSVEACLQVVANDTPSPLGQELRLCTDRIAMGLPLSDAMEELPYRTGLVSASVLATALGVHRETGGDLVRVLERLSQTIRDRIQFQGRLAAATAASRLTVLAIILQIVGTFWVFRVLAASRKT